MTDRCGRGGGICTGRHFTGSGNSAHQLLGVSLHAAERVKIVTRLTAEAGERKIQGDASVLNQGACLADFTN